jgi:hypothetical protein
LRHIVHGEQEAAVGDPGRSGILDCIEAQPPARQATTPAAEPKTPPSRILDYAEATPPPRPATAGALGPKPGVPVYHTPVYVPAHPRYVDTTDNSGRPARVPFIVYEFFEHPTDGMVAFAFTTLDNLVAALGEAQPWVATSIGPLAEGIRGHGAGVRLDPRVAPGQHNWRPADLAAYAQEVR